MGFWKRLEDSLPFVLPFLLALAALALVMILLHWILVGRKKELDPGKNVRRQIVRLLLTIIVVISGVLAMSIIPQTKDSAAVLAGLLGIVISAAVTISSATFIANAMAGLMLRAVRNFKIGDYIRVGEKFGRVSERGLFHIEIQMEDRDLTTLPNLYLVTQPVTVVRASGTIISTKVSLGYDVPHTRVKAALENAAVEAGLNDPFVYILELGDFSITYQIAGFLPEVKHLLSARSRLRTCVLDALHDDDIEIVSPTFVNQRRLSEKAVISKPDQSPAPPPNPEEPAPEDRMFDKAEIAEQREIFEHLSPEIESLEAQLAKASDEERGELEVKIESLREKRDTLEQSLAEAPEEDDVD